MIEDWLKDFRGFAAGFGACCDEHLASLICDRICRVALWQGLPRALNTPPTRQVGGRDSGSDGT
jgi:hypothetical protein